MLRQAAFTLIEALVTIGIIAVLAAILFPVYSSAQRSQQNTVCVAHLRSLGGAIQTFVAEHGYYPPSISGPSDTPPAATWRRYLRTYMGMTSTGTSESLNSPIIVCPARDIVPPSSAGILPTYSANGRLMPDLGSSASASGTLIRAANVQRLSEIIMLIDGTQQSSGSTNSYLYSVNITGNPAKADSPVAIGPNKAPVDGASYIRYRHNGAANAVFCDGHVGNFKAGDLREKNLAVSY